MIKFLSEDLKLKETIQEDKSILLVMESKNIELDFDVLNKSNLDINIIGVVNDSSSIYINVNQTDYTDVLVNINLINEGSVNVEVITQVNQNKESNSLERINILNKSTSLVKPILKIIGDQSLVNHSSYIGNIKDNDIYYLMTRGINKELAIKMLEMSFLFNEKTSIYKEEVMKFLGGKNEG